MGDEDVPASNFPLNECQGDCDSDFDCGPGLACFQRSESEAVPGCVGNGSRGTDYCYRVATASPITAAPTTPSPTTSAPSGTPTSAPITPSPTTQEPSGAPTAATDSPTTTAPTTRFPTEPPTSQNQPGEWNNIDYEDFEGDSNQRIWHAADSKESKIDAKYSDAIDSSISETNAIKLKKDKGEDSSAWTDFLNVTDYSKLKVDFRFLSKKMNEDGFYLEYTVDDNLYEVQKYFVEGTDYADDEDSWYQEIVELDTSTIEGIKVRFRCASTEKGEIWIDHIALSGQYSP